ncbi:uncharacterized protein LOC108092661 [Drosophila ficusphila]|uniref:uncharacterized protein LOC108092661 n=1 Tax=Drosophila ficusphila TaxID=30025 RepID=UPI0007E881EF|nr:uncharacterized protein LOC108092661 [Drosophila ficusphila]
MRAKNILLLILLLEVTIIFLNSALAKMDAFFTDIACPTYAPDLVKNVSCCLNPPLKGSLSSSYSAQFILTEDVSDAKGKYVVALKRGSSFINYTSLDLDYCQTLLSLQTQFLLKMIADELRRVANFPLQCPFKKNTTYYINRFTINSKAIPSYAPEMDFVSDCIIFVKKRKAMQLTIHGRVGRRRSGR